MEINKLKIENRLKSCLRFEEENITESESEKTIRAALLVIKTFHKITTGWTGYSWKNGRYIDDIQEYFDDYLSEMEKEI